MTKDFHRNDTAKKLTQKRSQRPDLEAQTSWNTQAMQMEKGWVRFINRKKKHAMDWISKTIYVGLERWDEMPGG
jgi:hypothetical protein